MAELEEPFAPVVVAHSRAADTAERCIMQRGVHHHIIERYPTRQGVLQHMALFLGVVAKVIKRQRPRAVVDLGNDLVDLIKGQQHHGRAEDFLVHDQAVRRRVDHQL
ncbi:hypothetical protein D3C77_546230 [compost metagenome]